MIEKLYLKAKSAQRQSQLKALSQYTDAYLDQEETKLLQSLPQECLELLPPDLQFSFPFFHSCYSYIDSEKKRAKSDSPAPLHLVRCQLDRLYSHKLLPPHPSFMLSACTLMQPRSTIQVGRFIPTQLIFLRLHLLALWIRTSYSMYMMITCLWWFASRLSYISYLIFILSLFFYRKKSVRIVHDIINHNHLRHHRLEFYSAFHSLHSPSSLHFNYVLFCIQFQYYS